MDSDDKLTKKIYREYAKYLDKAGILFDKPSRASAFALYGSSNGLVDCHDADGKKLKDLLNS